MREFILRAQKAKTGQFRIDDLPNEGRMDLVCRCISNALFLSNDMRRDTIIHVVFDGPPVPPKIISFYGETIKGFYFDEKNIAKTILNALLKGKNLNMGESIQVQEGISIQKNSFEALVKEKAETSKLIYLDEKGKDIRDIELPENITFVFGDYIGIPKNTERLLERTGAEKVTISPVMLFASHCITIVHNEIDRKSRN